MIPPLSVLGYSTFDGRIATMSLVICENDFARGLASTIEGHTASRYSSAGRSCKFREQNFESATLFTINIRSQLEALDDICFVHDFKFVPCAALTIRALSKT